MISRQGNMSSCKLAFLPQFALIQVSEFDVICPVDFDLNGRASEMS